MKKVTFTATGNGYHDVHFDGVHQKHLLLCQDDPSNGNNRFGGGTYTLINVNSRKHIIQNKKRDQIRSALEKHINKPK